MNVLLEIIPLYTLVNYVPLTENALVHNTSGMWTYLATNEGLKVWPDDIPLDIQVIRLGFNDMTEIEHIPHLPSVSIITASKNKLWQFPNLYNASANLRRLELDKNLISVILPERLDILESLEFLGLSYNYLTILPDVSGPSLSLETLYLQSNRFEVFPKCHHLGQSMKLLFMVDNILKRIESDDLKELPNITGLFIANNALQNIPDMTPIGSSLLALSVTNNPIRTLTARDMNALRQLTFLEAKSCELKYIPDFTNSTSKYTLQYMDLKNNLIDSAPIALINSLTALSNLNLAGNRLKSLPNLCHLQRPLFIYLRDNHFNCDCHMRWLKEAQLNGLYINMPYNFYPCAGPPELVGRKWTDLTEDNLTCIVSPEEREAAPRRLLPTYRCDVRDVTIWVSTHTLYECVSLCLDIPGCRYFRYGEPGTGNHTENCGLSEKTSSIADISINTRSEAWYSLD